MKSLVCLSSSVRAACQHTAACFPLSRALLGCGPVGRCANVDFTGRTVVAQQPRVTGERCLHSTCVKAAVVPQVSAAPLPAPLPPLLERREEELMVRKAARRVRTAPGPAAPFSPYSPYTSLQGSATTVLNTRALLEGDVIPELCSRLAALPSKDRAEGLATLLGACAECGLEAHSPAVLRLTQECQELLSSRGVEVAQLCHLGEVAHALGGRQSAMVAEVLDAIGVAVEEDTVTHGEAIRVYSLLALCHDPASVQETVMLSTLHRHTHRLLHQLTASQVGRLLQLLLKLQQSQAISLVLGLSSRASRVFPAFSDSEIISMLSTLTRLGQHNEELLAAMEKHLPGKLAGRDPELISSVMEYCLHLRWRSEPIFEAVAQNFVCHAERHTTLQIAKQIVTMGRLSYLPQCSDQMFEKLESILTTRYSQFQPHSLLEMLHACVHLERFPLNYMNRLFSLHFLQSLLAQGQNLERTARGQLTQLYLSTSLECHFYKGPRLPAFLQVKSFYSVDEAFETAMEPLLYKRVKGPLTQLLGGWFYLTRVFTPSGYTVDVVICLDEDGYVLPLSQWDHIHRRIALCLDGQNRFCRNTRHLLGKEATKRRHLRRSGYEVVQIPYYEFEALRTQKEQVQYLHQKLFPTFPTSAQPDDPCGRSSRMLL